ncbi:dethiobiotin synthase [Pedobacter arcticus]|uniref:dethiobiotin synthase n=1 Tax=Pedobacter arcticus TaxID=752140 RepID=UPI0002FBF3B4|nr:dethiobiotin synthase [Pedobacter arcticus]
MTKKYFVTGIGTEIGKTVTSAILTEHLKADYWKPIQSGDLHQSDTLKVKNLISNQRTKFHPEAYQLTQPFSPHYSAALDGVKIDLNSINLPETQNNLIVEGAGGLMVPLNNQDLIIDLIKKLGLAVVLVSKNYLGSINHTLLSVEALKSRNIPIKGIIFNGEPNQASESIIIKMTGLKVIANIPMLHKIDKESVKDATENLTFNW